MTRRALLVAAALLALPATAGARSYSVPAHVPDSEVGISAKTVALADGRVLWLERRGDGAALVAAAEDGIAHDVYALPPARGATHFLDVFADGGAAIVRRLVCVRSNCHRNAASDTVLVDLATGAATDLALTFRGGCLGAFTLRGSVLAARSCEPKGTVFDFADGARRELDGELMAAAGRYAAIRDAQRVTVVDWRTGAVVTDARDVHVDPRTQEVAIDDDGTLAWVEDGVKLLRRGAARPSTVPLAPDDTFIAQVALAQGRLGVRRWSESQVNTLQVSARDGTGRREAQGQRGDFGWAFDGTRIAWVAQPCGQTVIQVWDTTGDPPPPLDDHCVRARLARPAASLKGSRLTIVLRCPKTPERGCAGDVKADFPPGASTGWYGYRVPAGETRTQVMLLRNRARRASNRGRVTLESAYGGRRGRASVRIQSSDASA